MAQSRDSNVFDPSSPHSSFGGADSFKGTPDTRLTAFSPDEHSVRSSRTSKPSETGLLGTKSIQFPIANTGNTSSGGDKDPFVTAYSRTNTASQLSPTASTFHPFSSQISNYLANTLPASEGSTATMSAAMLSNDIGAAQCVQLSSPNQSLGLNDVTRYLDKLEGLGVLRQELRHIVCWLGKAYIRFDDLCSATTVHENVRRAPMVCEASYISESQWIKCTAKVGSSTSQVAVWALSAIPGTLDLLRAEGTVLRLLQSRGEVLAYHRQQQSHGLAMYAASAQYTSYADACAVVAAYNGRLIEDIIIHISVTQGQESSSTAVIQSCADGSSALPSSGRELAQSLQDLSFGKPMPAMQLVTPPTPTALDAGQRYPSMGFQVQQPYSMWPVFCPTQLQPNMAAYVLDNGQQGAAASISSPVNYQFTTPAIAEAGNSQMMAMSDEYYQPRTMPGYPKHDGRRQNASRVNRSSLYGAAGHHNHVEVGRIREGTDVRTTIMLRNIPNKVDQAMLKRIVDESSWGQYDFMYLRIDFANDCNVGYAFINFVDPLDIIDFVNARGNQRWNCFKSDKVAEISYATIQGKDCLVQKFRNSSVMLEAAHYRPKLFYTSNGPMPELAGQEETFPKPDNQSKMKRSCENAEHVGLFTPNAGQHFRDEQRRRRSQYDRGTRLAALEEHDFETAIQPYMHYSP